MTTEVVDREAWLRARRSLLEQEKALTRARDALTEARRALPWVRVDEPYAFDTTTGRRTLAELFGDHRRLIVHHYMFDPDWSEGCPSCSFWADSLHGSLPHLAARGVAYVVASQAPLEALQAFRARMGWNFEWVSAAPSGFGSDYHVHCTAEQIAAGTTGYNFTPGMHYGEHAPGISVFARDDGGAVFHTYSCYARGLDALNGTYQLLDLLPEGRNEQDLPFPMAWVRLHDRY